MIDWSLWRISCVRVPEIIFQPTMVGVDQCGVSDTIEFMLQYYSPEVQQRLIEVLYRILFFNVIHYMCCSILTECVYKRRQYSVSQLPRTYSDRSSSYQAF